MPEAKECKKAHFYSQAAAQAAVVKATMDRNAGDARRQERRFYLCEQCTTIMRKGVWHLSSAAVALPESEASFTFWVIRTMQQFGWLVAHVRPAQVEGKDGKTLWVTPYDRNGDDGLPDIIALRKGVTLLAELKSADGRVRPEQQKWLDNGTYLWRPADRPQILEIVK